MSGGEALFCRRCGKPLAPGGESTFYVVKVEAFADPTGPRVTREALEKAGGDEIEALLKALEGYSERELMDMVHRRMEFYLCAGCYVWWIEHPVG